MQPTYYEKLLADRASPLAAMLDADVSRLKARGPIIPNPEDADFADALGQYLKRALESFKTTVARDMSPYQFELFQQTPAYQEAMVQLAANQYWVYETFFYFKALGERTFNIGSAATKELLQAPLTGRARDFKLDAAAMMLVFDAPEMVDALYAGERRQAPGRTDYDAKVHVFVIEVPPSEGFKFRRLKMLSVHAGPHANHRVEVRRLLLQDDVELEELLKNGWNDSSQAASAAGQFAAAAAGNASGAKRTEDRGFYGTRIPYYRAVLGTLQRIAAKQGLSAHPAPSVVTAEVSRLAYQAL
jgi:hypothetical protein